MVDASKLRERITSDEQALFHGVPQATVDKVIQAGKVVSYSKGDTVWKVGDPASWLYIVVDGVVGTVSQGRTIRRLVPGDVGGVTSALPLPNKKASESKPKRSMTHVVISEKAELLRVPHAVYEALLHEEAFAMHALAFLNLRLREKTRLIGLLTGSRAESDAPPVAPPSKGDLTIAVFDTKPYDEEYLTAAFKPYANKSPKIQLKFVEPKLSEATVGLAVGCQAVCIFVNDKCDQHILSALHEGGVRLILLRCAGFDRVDLKAAAKLNMPVLRVPAYSPHAVAEHAFALLATVNRKTHRAYNRVRDGNFTLAGLVGRDLNGLTCGVAGCGKIGQCFVRIAKGCGMKVIIWDKELPASVVKELAVERVDDADELFKRCDVISFHVPLTKETRHLVDARRLALMKPGSIVVNTSRGAVVDADALLEALVEKKIGGAGLDVYERETAYFFENKSEAPISDQILARLVNLPNVVVTSHQAFLTDKALNAIATTTLENAKAYQRSVVEGKSAKDLPNAVPPPPPSSKL